MKSLAPNTLLQNRYLIVQLIGKGGMGEVYLAVDQRLGSAVALKRTFFTDDEMLGSAFEREARTLARLRHPVLPKVSDHFIENDNQYLVMEHISGDDLSKRLENAKKPFPLNWVLFWADQLLDSLHYLHSHNPPIVHRDIKPQNLKLTDENHIVLLDFGLAKDNVGNTRVTSSGSVVGFTPHYAPMEQIRGVGTNPKSDLYSLSSTLYQLLTNSVPADALTRADALLGKMPDPLVPVIELNPEVSRPISDIIGRGMALSLDRRLSTAREMQKLLRDGYAQMQNAMSAQTVAFNLEANTGEVGNGEIEQPEIAPPVSDRLDQFATVVNENSAASSNPSNFDSNGGVSDKTEQMNFADLTETFGDSASGELVSGNEPEFKQSGVKTEVFFAEDGILPTAEDEPEDKFNSVSEPESNDAPPKATVPFFPNADQEDSIPSEAPSAFDSVAFSGESAEEDFEFSSNEDISDVEEVYSDSETGYSQPSYNEADDNYSEYVGESGYQQTPPPKKSGGKAAFIAGGLFLFLILIAGAAGAGWYIYNNQEVATEDPQPTPEVTPSALPTPEATPEPTPEVANTEENNTNTDIVSTSNTNTAETGTKTNSAVITNPTPVRSQPTPVRSQPPTPVRSQPPTPVKPPPTPKKVPTPKKDDRTVPLP